VEAPLAVLAVLLAGYALVAARLDRLSIGPALAFVAIGIVLSDHVHGPISFEPDVEPIRLLAEATLALLLFADASTIPARAVERDIAPTARLLVVGLLLTLLLGTVTALVLFPGIELGVALLIGSALAPTDAALGQPVVTNPVVPARIRRLLTVESGLNDGIATPFVFLALALATAEATGATDWLIGAVTETAIGLAVGIIAGFVGGMLLRQADRRHWASEISRQLFVLALAGSCYLVAASAGGNGFIAAFVGGLAFGGGTRGLEKGAVRFTETQGSLLAIGVWVTFGLTLGGRLVTDLSDPAVIAYAILSLTIIRMAPVAIALVGTRFSRPTILFMGWFGPRGLASIVFLIIGLQGLDQARVDAGPFGGAVAWTVLLSVIAHGLTAEPLAARYGRRVASLPADAPEVELPIEAGPSRTSWAGDAPKGPST
jgi:NhaP-type Na+/H+ or K+/H+ antiporter